MKKINYLMAMFIAAVLCVGLVSCHKSKNDDPEPEAKYLSAEDFAKSTWNGQDDRGLAIQLKVESTSSAKLTYTPKSAAKNTDPTPVTITIEYTYTASTGAFSGKGKEDGFSYSATLKDQKNMSIKIPTGTFDLKR